MKDKIEQLIEDYKRRLATVNEEKEKNIGEMKYQRLEAKASCFRYFIVELQRIIKP